MSLLHTTRSTIRTVGMLAGISPCLLVGIGLCEPVNAQTEEVKKTQKQKQPEISDRSLYSEVLFAEIFEKDRKKACRLLERLLSRKIERGDLRIDAEHRYRRLLLSAGDLDRYRAHIRKTLNRKDIRLYKGERDILARTQRWLDENGDEVQSELTKKIQGYTERLDKAKDLGPEKREAIRLAFYQELDGYMSRGGSLPTRPDDNSREERATRSEMRLQRVQDLQARIDKLKKEGKAQEAQKLGAELRRVIQEEDPPRRGPGGRNVRMAMMRGFYSARRQIEKSGNKERLAEFNKLWSEVRSLLVVKKDFQKAREVMKDAEKRFPEIRRRRR